MIVPIFICIFSKKQYNTEKYTKMNTLKTGYLEAYRWDLFLKICEQSNLFSKAGNIKDWRDNFDGAYNRADKLARFYIEKSNVVENFDEIKDEGWGG